MLLTVNHFFFFVGFVMQSKMFTCKIKVQPTYLFYWQFWLNVYYRLACVVIIENRNTSGLSKKLADYHNFYYFLSIRRYTYMPILKFLSIVNISKNLFIIRYYHATCFLRILSVLFGHFKH